MLKCSRLTQPLWLSCFKAWGYRLGELKGTSIRLTEKYYKRNAVLLYGCESLLYSKILKKEFSEDAFVDGAYFTLTNQQQERGIHFDEIKLKTL